MKGVQNGVRSLVCGFRFDDRWDRPIGGGHWIGYAASYASGHVLVLSRQSMSRLAAGPVPPLQRPDCLPELDPPAGEVRPQSPANSKQLTRRRESVGRSEEHTSELQSR